MNERRPIKVKFKGLHSEYFRNSLELPISNNEYLIVEADGGEDIGRAKVNLYQEEHNCNEDATFSILRKANDEDIMKNFENRILEKIAFRFCEKKIEELQLAMNLIEVEYRLDRKKITFYYTSDDRVDFRDLVKLLAAEYKTRIEMRQISSREEMKKTDTVGLCGRPLCCSSWLDDFQPITMQIVRNQNVPMNPSKITGCCGKLKCCFQFEYETYSEFLKDYPPYGSKIKYNDNEGTIEKIDIFQKTVTIKFQDERIEELPLRDLGEKIEIIAQNE